MSQRDVADRAGVEVEYVGKLVGLGVFDPTEDAFSDGDVRRARLYQGLERAGLPIEAMVEAVARGELSFAFLDLPVWDRFSGLSPRSFREVSSQETIPLELLMVVREAIGFAQADPDDRMREDELRVLPIIKLQLSKGFDPAVIERWLRVYGETLRRIDGGGVGLVVHEGPAAGHVGVERSEDAGARERVGRGVRDAR